MLSFKYFVSFVDIFRFSLNWRTHLLNDLFFEIYFTYDHCPYGLYSIRLCFLKFLVKCLNVIVHMLCIFCLNFRFSQNWRKHLPNDVIFVIYFTSCHCPYGLYYIHLCFLKFLDKAWMLSFNYFVSFCWNFKIIHKLTDTVPKWRHLWNLFYVNSLPPWFVLHPFVFPKIMV